MTATLTATVSAEGAGLPESHAFLVQRDMRVDRYRGFYVSVADNVADHVWRDAMVEQERHAGMAQVMKPGLAEPAPVRMAYQLRRRLSGSIGVPRREGEDQTVILPVRSRVGALGELLLPMFAKCFEAR